MNTVITTRKINLAAPCQSLSWLVYFLITVFVYITCETAQAQYLSGPIASGEGGAGRAGAEASEASLLNPAAIVHSPELSSALYYSKGSPAPGEFDRFYGLSLVDNSKDILLPGALSYFRRQRGWDQFGEVKEELIQFSVANFVWEQLAFGATAVYLHQKITGETPAGGGLEGRKYTQWNGVLGLHYSPTPNLGFALVDYYFVPPESGLPDALRLPPQISFGSYFIFNDVIALKLDVSQPRWNNEKNRLITQVGIDSNFSAFFVFRMGHSWDNWRDRRTGTLGLAFNSPQFRLDYSYQTNMDKSGHTIHSVDLRVPF